MTENDLLVFPAVYCISQTRQQHVAKTSPDFNTIKTIKLLVVFNLLGAPQIMLEVGASLINK